MITKELLAAEEAAYIVTIQFAGRSWHWATAPQVEIRTRAGDVILCEDGLEFEFSEQLQIGRAVTPRSVPLELRWPQSIHTLLGLGYDLAAATGEIALWCEGALWEDRLVLMRDGIVSDPIVGEDEEPVAFSLAERDTEDDGTVMPPEAFVDAATWPDAPSSGKGTPYPLVLGSPGPFVESDGVSSKAGATPARVVKTTGGVVYLLIAGHPTVAGAGGGSVAINNKELAEWQTMAALHVVDGRGRTCTVVDANAHFVRVTDPWTSAHTFACSWESSGGGLRRRDSTGVTRSAGDVIAVLLAASSRRVDWGRTWAAVPQLAAYRLDGYHDQGAPLDIVDEILAICPVALMLGPDGIFPWVWRHDAPEDEVIAELVDGVHVAAGAQRWEGRDHVANEITLCYAWGRQRTSFQRRRTLTGDLSRESETDMIVTKESVNSRLRYGLRRKTVETQWVYREEAASAVLTWLGARYGRAWRSIVLYARSEWAWLRPGSFVRVSVPSRGLVAVGWVRTVTHRPGEVTLDVLLRG